MELERISVQNVQKSDGKFSATVTVADLILDTTKTYEVGTNRRGCGFWIDGKQCTGTSQFQVSTKDAFRAAVRRWFTD